MKVFYLMMAMALGALPVNAQRPPGTWVEWRRYEQKPIVPGSVCDDMDICGSAMLYDAKSVVRVGNIVHFNVSVETLSKRGIRNSEAVDIDIPVNAWTFDCKNKTQLSRDEWLPINTTELRLLDMVCRH